MSLLDLPNEALLVIANNLPGYRDIRALRCASRRFYSLLKGFRFAFRHGTLLHYAASVGDLKLATNLLDGFATPQTKPSESRGNKNTEPNNDEINEAVLAHPLFKKGYAPDTILDIQFAFLAAIEEDSKQLVTLLLDRGAKADFRFPVQRYYDPFGGPCFAGSVAEIRQPSPLTLAVKAGDGKLFDLLVGRGAETCTTDCPLEDAVEGRQFYMIKVLLERSKACHHRFFLLNLALRKQDRTTFDYLLEIGLRVDLFGDSALLFSIQQGDEKMMRFLIEKGADPHIAEMEDCSGHLSTPKPPSSVYTAISNGHTEICKMLVEEYGVRPDREDLGLAQEKGNQELIDYLSRLSYDNVPAKMTIPDKIINILDDEAWSNIW